MHPSSIATGKEKQYQEVLQETPTQEKIMWEKIIQEFQNFQQTIILKILIHCLQQGILLWRKSNKFPTQLEKNPKRNPRPTRHVKTNFELQEFDAKDAGATTPCGLPAAMDSATAPKATSLIKLRSHSNQRNGTEARTPRPSSVGMMDLDSDISSDDL